MITLEIDPEKRGPAMQAITLAIPAAILWAGLNGVDTESDDFDPISAVTPFLKQALTTADGTNAKGLEAKAKELLFGADTHTPYLTGVDLALKVVGAYLYDAFLTGGQGDEDAGWESADSARFWTGVATGLLSASGSDKWSKVQASAIDARHAENRAIRKQAFDWLDCHFEQEGMTQDEAAEGLKAIVPMAFSTRLKYVKDWKKAR